MSASMNHSETSNTNLKECDSDEEESSYAIGRNRVVKAKLMNQQVSEEEVEYFWKYFPSLAVPNITSPLEAPVPFLKLKMLKHTNDCILDFSDESISCDELLHHAIQSNHDSDHYMDMNDIKIDLMTLVEDPTSKEVIAEEKDDTTSLELTVISIGINWSELSRFCKRHKEVQCQPIATAPTKTNYNKYYGLSLNERFHGSFASSCRQSSEDTKFPKFDIFAELDEQEIEICEQKASTTKDSFLEDLQEGFRNCAQLFTEGGRNKTESKFQNKKIIFVIDIEVKLFNLLTKISQGIISAQKYSKLDIAGLISTSCLHQ